MLVCWLMGGLGNQMFQYSAARARALDLGIDLVLDAFYVNLNRSRSAGSGLLLNQFCLGEEERAKLAVGWATSAVGEQAVGGAPRVGVIGNINKFTEYTVLALNKLKLPVIKFYQTHIIKQQHYTLFDRELEPIPQLYNNDMLSIVDNTYIKGYFQNEQYFIRHRQQLLKDLTPKPRALSACAKLLVQEIASDSGNNQLTVSLHIRRGDYIRSNFNTLDADYYEHAIKLIESQTPHKNLQITYFVFSDDIAYSQAMLAPLTSHKIIYCGNADFTPVESLWAMSKCQHNIIANSSFSWWAAWLNQNANKTIIAPRIWISHLPQSHNIIADSWHKI